MANIEITEGWSGPIDVQLQADGVVYDLTGKTVNFIKRDTCGQEVVTTTSGSQLETIASTCGLVRYTPSTGDLLVSGQPYWVKVRVIAGAEKVYFPNGAGDTWTVFSQ